MFNRFSSSLRGISPVRSPRPKDDDGNEENELSVLVEELKDVKSEESLFVKVKLGEEEDKTEASRSKKWKRSCVFNSVNGDLRDNVKVFLHEKRTKSCIGEGSISLKNLKAKKKLTKWVELKKSRKSCGKLKVTLTLNITEFDTEKKEKKNQEIEVNNIEVEILKAKNLRSADKDGKSDPYCVLRVGREKKKTKVIQNSLDPEWTQNFVFGKNQTKTNILNNSLFIDIYDDDGYFRDDLLGHVTIPLDKVVDNKRKWYKLVKKKGSKQAAKGELLLGIKFDSTEEKKKKDRRIKKETQSDVEDEENEEEDVLPKDLIAHVKILKAKKLPAKDRRTKSSDPYCIVKVGREQNKTRVINTSLNPEWNEEFSFGKKKNKKIKEDTKILFEIRDKDFVTSEKLGAASLSIVELYEKYQQGNDTHWVTLDTEQESQLQFKITFQANNDEMPKTAIVSKSTKRSVEDLVLEIANLIEASNRKNDKFDLKGTFEMYDKDGSGTISAEEFKEMLELLDIGSNISNEELSDLVKVFDLDGDGQVDYREFISIVQGEEALEDSRSVESICEGIFEQDLGFIRNVNKLEKSLSCFDVDGTGGVDIENKFNRAVKLSGGVPVESAKERDIILKHFAIDKSDPEKSKLINYKAFCEYVKHLHLNQMNESEAKEETGNHKDEQNDDEFEKDTKVRIKLIKAEGLRAADWNGKSDPFCLVTLGKQKKKTKIMKKTLDPEWNEEFILGEGQQLEKSSQIVVTVRDHDLIMTDFLGSVKINVKDMQYCDQDRKATKAKWYNLTGKKAKGKILIESSLLLPKSSETLTPRLKLMPDGNMITDQNQLQSPRMSPRDMMNTYTTVKPESNNINNLKSVQKTVTNALRRLNDDSISLRQLLENGDKKQTGWMNAKDFLSILRDANIDLSQSDMNIILPRIDPEGKDELDYSLFCKLVGVEKVTPSFVREKIKKALKKAKKKGINLEALFSVFDTKHRGMVSTEEFIETMKILKLSLDKYDIRALSKTVKMEQDGLIPYADVLQSIDPDINIFTSGSAHNKETVDGSLRYIRNSMKQRMATNKHSKDLLSVFEEMDRNGDGKVSKREFKAGLKRVGIMISDNHIKNLLDHFNCHGDGKIDYFEFISMVGETDQRNIEVILKRLSKPLRGMDQSLARAFHKHDMNGDGKIPRKQFRRTLGTIEHDLNPFELRSLMDYLDPHALGFVNISKFFSALGMDENHKDDARLVEKGATKDIPTLKTRSGYSNYDFAMNNNRFNRFVEKPSNPWHSNSIESWLQNGATPSERKDFDTLYRSITSFSTLKKYDDTYNQSQHLRRKSPYGYERFSRKTVRLSPSSSRRSRNHSPGRRYRSRSPSYRSDNSIGWECNACSTINQNNRSINICGICGAIRQTNARVFEDGINLSNSLSDSEYSNYSNCSSTYKRRRRRSRRGRSRRRRGESSKRRYDSSSVSCSSSSLSDSSSSSNSKKNRYKWRRPMVPKEYVESRMRSHRSYSSSTESSTENSDSYSDSQSSHDTRNRKKSRGKRGKKSYRSSKRKEKQRKHKNRY